ncbi:hypothetical protein OMK64_10130 [Cellulomonas fimi]|uniref:hypothetical protein n=1 Tax=Cellulomonas fimi TaxID=1708 RepID=UPI00234CE0CC|nr:hypothetical protein [Cellulomonas fimi]MDC7121892.1 hypothetical protein [Cellulomonas fimi]
MRDDLVGLVARTPLWAALDERRRRGAAAVLVSVARASAGSGALVTLLRLGSAGDARSEPEVSTISLTWLRTAPLRADLTLARVVVQGDATVDTGIGPGLVARRVERTVTGALSSTSQVAAPVPGSIWLAVVTGTTSAPQYADDLHDAVLAFAAGLHVDRPSTAPPDRVAAREGAAPPH